MFEGFTGIEQSGIQSQGCGQFHLQLPDQALTAVTLCAEARDVVLSIVQMSFQARGQWRAGWKGLIQRLRHFGAGQPTGDPLPGIQRQRKQAWMGSD